MSHHLDAILREFIVSKGSQVQHVLGLGS